MKGALKHRIELAVHNHAAMAQRIHKFEGLLQTAERETDALESYAGTRRPASGWVDYEKSLQGRTERELRRQRRVFALTRNQTLERYDEHDYYAGSSEQVAIDRITADTTREADALDAVTVRLRSLQERMHRQDDALQSVRDRLGLAHSRNPYAASGFTASVRGVARVPAPPLRKGCFGNDRLMNEQLDRVTLNIQHMADELDGMDIRLNAQRCSVVWHTGALRWTVPFQWEDPGDPDLQDLDGSDDADVLYAPVLYTPGSQHRG